MNNEFTKSKIMEFPSAILAGHGVINQVADICNKYNLPEDAIIITGENSYRFAGNIVERILKDNKYRVNVIFTKEASTDNLDAIISGIKTINRKKFFLVGVGGGSKIDLTKLVAFKLHAQYISIPTIASHDGISSPRASLKNENIPVSIEASIPLAVIADTEIILRAPFRFLASGCADVISNITAVMDWKLASRLRNEPYSSSAATLAQYTAETILDNAKNIKPELEESVWVSIKPMLISGISMIIAGSSRPTSGAEHMFSHALDRLGVSKALHGEQCGIGTIMMMYLHGGDWERIKEALKTIGTPTTAKGLGISDNDLIKALTIAHEIRHDRYTILGDKGISKESAYNVAKATGVI